jgi:hypothetical protein
MATFSGSAGGQVGADYANTVTHRGTKEIAAGGQREIGSATAGTHRGNEQQNCRKSPERRKHHPKHLQRNR